MIWKEEESEVGMRLRALDLWIHEVKSKGEVGCFLLVMKQREGSEK